MPSQSPVLPSFSEHAYSTLENEIINAINNYANPIELNCLLRAVEIISDEEVLADIRKQELYKIKKFRNMHSGELQSELCNTLNNYISLHDKRPRI